MLEIEYPLSLHISDPIFASTLVVDVPVTEASKGESNKKIKRYFDNFNEYRSVKYLTYNIDL